MKVLKRVGEESGPYAKLVERLYQGLETVLFQAAGAQLCTPDLLRDMEATIESYKSEIEVLKVRRVGVRVRVRVRVREIDVLKVRRVRGSEILTLNPNS